MRVQRCSVWPTRLPQILSRRGESASSRLARHRLGSLQRTTRLRKLLARKRVPRTNGRRIRSICRGNRKSTSARKRSSFLRTVDGSSKERKKERDTRVLYFGPKRRYLQFTQQERKEEQSSFLGREYTHTRAHFSRARKKRKCPLPLKTPFTRLIFLLLLSADAALLLAL